MSTLKQLLEERDTLFEEYEALVLPSLEEDAEPLSEEQETKRSELRENLDKLESRISELEDIEARKAKFAEARKIAGTDAPSVDMKVVNEPKTYGPDAEQSYFADLVRAYSPLFNGHRDAVERLNKYEYEVSVEVARNTDDGKRAARLIQESRRSPSGNDARRIVETMRERGNAGSQNGVEDRAMSAGASSGGSFVTPVYFVSEYAPYRLPGRAFIDQCNTQPLPDYGMTVYLPQVQSDAAVATQESAPGTNENAAVQETDPTAGYLSANLITKAGQVTVSQQLLDRAGPNFAFDRLVFDQLTRDYNAAADTYVLTQALSTAATTAYNASAFVLTSGTETAGTFYQKIAGAKAAIRTTSGTIMDPTHLFLDPSRWEYCAAQSDTTGRPLIVPGYAGVFNAAAGGNGNGETGYEGDTGYRMGGLPVFQDLNIPAPSSGRDQAIVGALAEVYVWEGDLVPRVLPQTLANQLSVILQVYAYLAVIPRYPSAINKITGTGMGGIAF